MRPHAYLGASDHPTAGRCIPRLWAKLTCLLGISALALSAAIGCYVPSDPGDPQTTRAMVKPAAATGSSTPRKSPEPSAPTISGIPSFTSAVQVGDPIRPRFPTDSAAHSFIRSIRAMVTHGDRILLGYGDYWNNSGRTDVWAMTENAGVVSWTLDFVVDDQMVDTFRVYEGTLYVPGIDATENWSFGNFYTRSWGTWTKHRTVPNAIHVMDIAKLQGNLFVQMWDEVDFKILKSSDLGATWSGFTKRGVYGRLIALDDALLIFGETQRGTVYRSDGIRTVRLGFDAFPGSGISWPRPDRMVRFLGGAAYASVDFMSPGASAPLYFLNDFVNGPVRVGPYGQIGQKNVRDLQVVDGSLYVMSAQPDPERPGWYLGTVDASADLGSWIRIAEFAVPAPPYSFSILNGSFYVGLGADGWWYDSTAMASGSVWRLVE